MKVLLTTFFLFTIIILSSCKEKQESLVKDKKKFHNSFGNELLIYTNSAQKITIGYPKNWDTVNRDKSFIFMAREKPKLKEDAFTENFTLNVIELNVDIPMRNVIQLGDSTLSVEYPTIRKLNKSIQRNKNGIVYGFIQNEIPAYGKQAISTIAYFKKNKKLYILGLIYFTKSKLEYEALYQEIIDSFKFN